MALTKISTGGVKDDAASQAKIADEAVDEARLQVSNAGTNGQFLQKQSGSTGGLTWATATTDTSDKASLSGATFTGNIGVSATGADAKRSLTLNGTNGSSEQQSLIVESDGENGRTDFKFNVGGGTPDLNMRFTGDATELYFNGANKKLETTATGINVTGQINVNGSPLAGGVSSDAQQNTVGGTNAGDSFTGTDANDNTLFGYNAGTAITSGDQNTAFGSKALDSSTTGAENVALGYECLQSVTTAQTNTAVGWRTLDACTTGGTNTGVGGGALSELTTATANVAVGTYASLRVTTGYGNTSVGHNALTRIETNAYNVAVGLNALKERVAAKCTAVGVLAGGTATSGGENTFVGYEAGAAWSGIRGVAIGGNAGSGNGYYITGGYNIAIGYEAMRGFGGADTSGSNNIAIGYGAGMRLTSGSENLVFGFLSGTNITTGQRNCTYGVDAGRDITTGSDNICIGKNSGRSGSPSGAISTGSYNVVLGDNNIQNLYCADTSISSSDQRDKTDITDFTHGLSWVNKLKPVTYRWDKRTWYNEYNEDGSLKTEVTRDGSKKTARQHIGFLAQDVLAVEQADGFASKKDDMLVVNLNEDDSAYGLKYERLVPVLVNAIKELSAKVETLETKVAALESA